MPKARGTFEVKTTPVSGGDQGVASGRMSLVKSFTGDLAGASRGDMWTVGTEARGSAGYVAIERVEGALDGRAGSFALLHQGTMRRGDDFQLRIVVVPDSGTADLAGIAGVMTIRIENGKHDYEFDYTLPAERGGE